MPKKALIQLMAVLALATPGLAQFKFDHNPGVLATTTVGTPLKLDIGVTAVIGTLNSVNYSISGSLPAGTTFANVSNGSGMFAEITGTPTTAATSNFTITAVANMSTGTFSGSLPLSIVVNSPVGVTVTPGTLTFNPNPSSTSPFAGIQFVDVISAGSSQTQATVTMDNGSGGAAPLEFSFSPGKVNTPGRVFVSFTPTPSSTLGSKNARLIVTPAGGGQPSNVSITGLVNTKPTGLSVFPNRFSFTHRPGDTGIKHRKGFLMSSMVGDSYITQLSRELNGISVAPMSGVTSGGIATFDVAVDFAQSLNVNDFSIPIMFSSSAGSARCNVIASLPPAGPGVRAFARRTHFATLVGGPIFIPRFGGGVTIYNPGSPNSTLNFRTTILTGTPNDFSFGAGGSIPQDGTGSATPLQPYQLNLTFKPSTKIGLDYALLNVSSQTDPSVSTQIVASLETMQNAPPVEADVNPASLVLVVTGNTAVTKTFSPSTTGPATSYIATFNSDDGGSWGTLSQTVGTLSNQFSPNITFTAIPSLLPGTINRGQINTYIGTTMVTAGVLVIKPQSGPSADHARDAAGCTPTQVVVAPGIRSGFSNPMGFASGISAEIYDDCGNALTGEENTVVAVFDNGDPPMALENLGAAAGEGAYLGMWTPLSAQAATTVTFVAASGNLKPGMAALSGTVTANQFNTPVLFDGGTVNNTNPFGGPVLAPGMVTSMYGLNLAPSAVSPGVIPLTNSSNGTSVTIGGKPAPFYFLSNGQLNVQAPTDLVPGQPASVAVQTSTGFAVLPTPVSVFSAAPGVSSFADGHIIAQHADFTLVDAAHPAKPGETIVIYLSGMGATTPSVATGQQSSATSLTPAQIQPTVTVGGNKADIAYAGLTPGGIGLYQINLSVPTGLSAGDAIVVVTQNGFAANRSLLPVAAQ